MKKLERYETASSKLAHEIDIVQLLQVQRLTSFIAKLTLSKQQRALVPSFREYQLSNLSNEKDDIVEPAEQEESIAQLKAEIEKDESLTHEQRIFLCEIVTDFNLQDTPANKAILYEVTGFKDEASTFEFWKDYGDFRPPKGPKIPNGSAAKEMNSSHTLTSLVYDNPNMTVSDI